MKKELFIQEFAELHKSDFNTIFEIVERRGWVRHTLGFGIYLYLTRDDTGTYFFKLAKNLGDYTVYYASETVTISSATTVWCDVKRNGNMITFVDCGDQPTEGAENFVKLGAGRYQASFEFVEQLGIHIEVKPESFKCVSTYFKKNPYVQVTRWI